MIVLQLTGFLDTTLISISRQNIAAVVLMSRQEERKVLFTLKAESLPDISGCSSWSGSFDNSVSGAELDLKPDERIYEKT